MSQTSTGARRSDEASILAATLCPPIWNVSPSTTIPADQRRCPECGVEMKSLGVTHCEHLDIIPAKVVVVHRTDEALKCPLDGTIVSARPPPRIVEKGVLGN